MNWDLACYLLGLKGSWQNNDGDMGQHWADLHLTNSCLLACHVMLLLGGNWHVHVFSNAVIKVPPQSSALICWLNQMEEKRKVHCILLGEKNMFTPFYKWQIRSITTPSVLGYCIGWMNWMDQTCFHPFTLMYAFIGRTFEFSSLPYYIFLWIAEMSLKSFP